MPLGQPFRVCVFFFVAFTWNQAMHQKVQVIVNEAWECCARDLDEKNDIHKIIHFFHGMIEHVLFSQSSKSQDIEASLIQSGHPTIQRPTFTKTILLGAELICIIYLYVCISYILIWYYIWLMYMIHIWYIICFNTYIYIYDMF